MQYLGSTPKLKTICQLRKIDTFMDAIYDVGTLLEFLSKCVNGIASFRAYNETTTLIFMEIRNHTNISVLACKKCYL